MSKTLKPVTVEFPDYPNPEWLHMMVHFKGGPMREKKDRKAKEKKNSWRKEEY